MPINEDYCQIKQLLKMLFYKFIQNWIVFFFHILLINIIKCSSAIIKIKRYHVQIYSNENETELFGGFFHMTRINKKDSNVFTWLLSSFTTLSTHQQLLIFKCTLVFLNDYFSFWNNDIREIWYSGKKTLTFYVRRNNVKVL